MAVITASQKIDSKSHEILTTKKHIKHQKTRPITATLEYPLILDIKLLKKLDMTTFTKKGLIALSKFCGISLINKTDSKKKFNKCVKKIQYSKKYLGNECNEGNALTESNRNSRTKRKFGKQIAKSKPRIRFKLAKGETSPDEDALDVICKKHSILKMSNQNSGMKDKPLDRKSLLENILSDTIENIIPEPCKTCSRSEHPERFHSHPKMMMRLSQEKMIEKNLEENENEERIGNPEKKKNNPCANQDKELYEEKKIPEKTNSSKSTLKSPTKSNSSAEVSPPDSENKIKSKKSRKPLILPPPTGKSKTEILKKSNSKVGASQGEAIKVMSGEEDLKYVTGCYVCGKQVSPKLRIKHEKSCILEWRTQNSLVSPDSRKPEPKRPDYRFTASGELDCEGTFESIWANHMESLVPCKKCGRKFFPDRLERHENCCNNPPLNIKYKH